jgi:hypothetical protein
MAPMIRAAAALLLTLVTAACATRTARPAVHEDAADRSGVLGLSWLTLGPHRAEIMTLDAPPEMEAIAARFKEAVRRNAAWFEAYVQEHDGRTLPWHAKMGITREEYEELVRTQGNLGLRKQRDTVLILAEDGREVTISTGGDWRFFDDLAVRIRGDATQATTSVGALPERVEVRASPQQSVTGPWDGTCWRASELTSLCLGKTAAGRGILFYQARVPDDARPQAHTDFVLLFDVDRAALAE